MVPDQNKNEYVTSLAEPIAKPAGKATIGRHYLDVTRMRSQQ